MRRCWRLAGESIIYTSSDGSPYEKRVDAKGRVLSDESIADEVPFELPEGWCWARLESISMLLNGDRGKSYPAKSKLHDSGIPFVSALNIEDGRVTDNKMLYLSEGQYRALRAGKLEQGDSVFCIRGSLGKHGVFPFERGAIASSLVIVRPINSDLVLTQYIELLFDSPVTTQEIKRYNNGTAQPNLAARDFQAFLYPLPPLAEQRRIAGRVSELMPLVEAYGELEDAREGLDAALPDRLRRSVLREAVRGRLAPQDPSDEPASELLGRIRAKRRALAAEGKVKLPKGGDSVIFTGSDGRRYEKRVDAKGRESEPVCIEGEIPFEIPEGWEWARFTQVVPVQYGFAADSSKFVTDESIGLIRIRDVNSGDLVHTTVNYSGEWSEEYLIRSGDDLVGMDGEFICKRWRGPDALLNQRVCCFRYLSDTVDRDYVSFTINWYLNQIWKQTSKTTVKHLSARALDRLLFAVPPAKEQKRIMDRANTLLGALE